MRTGSILGRRAIYVIAVVVVSGCQIRLIQKFTAATFSNPPVIISKMTLQPVKGRSASDLAPSDQVFLVAGGGRLEPSAELFTPATPGTFAATVGRMTTLRFNHTATVITSGGDAGKVLITGGEDMASNQLASAEIYDPNTGTFSCVGAAVNGECPAISGLGRQYHTATVLNDGTILIAGGANGTASPIPFAGGLIYHPLKRTFSPTVGSLSTARFQHTATLLHDGTVLITGGFDINFKELASAEIYNPHNGMFTPTAGPMLDALVTHTATFLDPVLVAGPLAGEVLIAGGFINEGTPTASAELYNPATGTFAAANSMSEARNSHAAVLMGNGKVLMLGGQGAVAKLADAEVFDPPTGTFKPTNAEACPSTFQGTAPPAGCMVDSGLNQTATLLTSGPRSGMVLIAGGFQDVRAAEYFDPSDNAFLVAPNPPIAERVSADATLLNDGSVLFTGGEPIAAIEPQAELYDVTQKTSIPMAPMVTPRAYGSIAILNNKRLLLAGGLDGQQDGVPSNAAELFDIPSLSFLCPDGSIPSPGFFPCPAASLMHGFRIGPTATLIPSGVDAGKVLLAGGDMGLFFTAPVATAELYDPVGGDFTCIGGVSMSPPACNQSMTEVRAGQTATLMTSGPQAGKILLAGGNNLKQGETATTNSVATAELYDTANETFRCVGTVSASPPVCNPSMTVGRLGHTASLITKGSHTGQILIAGGTNPSDTALATAELYNPATGTFTCVGGVSARPPICTDSMTVARTRHSATTLHDGRILIVGGSSGDGATGFRALRSAEIYDPISNTFAATGSMATARTAHSAMLLANGEVAIAGGAAGKLSGKTPDQLINSGINSHTVASIEVFDPAEGTFSPGGAMGSDRAEFLTAQIQAGGPSPTPTATPSAGPTPGGRIAVSANPVVFPNAGLGAAPTDKNFLIQNLSAKHHLVGSVGSPGTASFIITSGGGPLDLGPLGVGKVKMQFKPSGIGLEKDSLTVTSNDKLTPALIVKLRGTGEPGRLTTNIALLPPLFQPILAFGRHAHNGGMKSLNFKIKNFGIGVVAGNVPALGGTFTVTVGFGAFNLAPGATKLITVKFAPTTTGHLTQALVITVTPPGKPVAGITVRMTGRGT